VRRPRGKEAAKQLAIKEDRERVANDDEGGTGVAALAGRQDWRRWVDGVDWPDWWAWLQRAGEISLTVRAFAEDEPGDRIRDHLALT
jgi:hypothetical protein